MDKQTNQTSETECPDSSRVGWASQMVVPFQVCVQRLVPPCFSNPVLHKTKRIRLQGNVKCGGTTAPIIFARKAASIRDVSHREQGAFGDGSGFWTQVFGSKTRILWECIHVRLLVPMLQDLSPSPAVRKQQSRQSGGSNLFSQFNVSRNR